MNRSESINELAAALAKAQAEIEGAIKDSENPHFRSKYADLAAVREACNGPLTRHGLAVAQSPRLVNFGEGHWAVELETMLMHTSGQFLTDALVVPVSRPDAQGVGSAITYARRYALAAFAGVAPEDDDAEAAVGRPNGHGATKAAPAAPPKGGMETVVGKILSVDPKGNKTVVRLSDGKNYGTMKADHATTVAGAREAGAEVEITYKPNDWGGRDIVAVKELVKADAPF